jgi:hypothetical protein
MRPVVTIPPLFLLLLLICLFLTCGCGKKGPVKPLRQPLPAAPTQLTVLQQGNLMKISWQIPATNQDGSALEDLQGFNIYKMRYNLADDCPECRDISVLMRQVDLDFLKNAERQGSRLMIWDNDLEAGFGYQYRVTAYTRQHREGEPVVIRYPFLAPIAAPHSLQTSGHDRMVRLSWQPPDLIDGMRIHGYNLYRRAIGEPSSPFPINSQRISETSFEDFGLANGTTQVYRVRMIVESRGMLLESAASTAAEAIPEEGK